jgi:hypothetical protein
LNSRVASRRSTFLWIPTSLGLNKEKTQSCQRQDSYKKGENKQQESYRTLSCSLRMRMRYWWILVSLCLALWTRKFGQYWSCCEICSSAFVYVRESLTRSHMFLGVWARSMVFIYK